MPRFVAGHTKVAGRRKGIPNKATREIREAARGLRRLPRPPHTVTLVKGAQTLYWVELSAAPSRAWRAAFLRPPATLTTARYTPELGRLGLEGARVHFRSAPSRLHAWLRRIDQWVAYANSVVQE